MSEPRKRRAASERLATIAPPILTAIVVIAVWQAATTIFTIEQYILPSPRVILDVYLDDFHLLWHNGIYTLFEAVVGFVIGCVVGWVIGVAMASWRPVELSLLPYVVGATTIPVVAIAPIVILALGVGIASKIFVTAFLCFFPMCINTLKGLRSSPAGAIELMHVNAAPRLMELWKVRIPASLPYVFVGLRLAASTAVIGAIIAEFVGATRGFGYMIVQASYQLDAPTMWAAMLGSAVLGIGLYGIVATAERKIVHWHEETTL